MNGRLVGRAGAAAALAALVVAAGPATPALAEPAVTIDSPAANRVFETETVAVNGSANVDNGLLFSMKDVSLSAGSQSTTVTCDKTPCDFSWSPSFPLNGSYELKVTGTQKTILLGSTGSSTTATRSFGVAAPPKAPTLDPPQVTGDRTVALSWSRNTEGDLLYYAVFRADPGSTKFNKIGENVKQPTSGSKVTFTDTTTTFAGGDYTYRVAAVRKGVGTAEVSSTSKQAAASVPAPPTTTVAPGAPGSPQAGPTTTAKPGPPGGVDLNNFLASRAAPKVLTPPTTPELPDTGFNENLPFGARPPGDDAEPGDEQATPPDDGVISVVEQLRGGRPLVPVAAGLILLLLAMHLRLLNRRVKAGGGDLPVEPSTGAAEATTAAGGRALPGVRVVDDDDVDDEYDEYDDGEGGDDGPPVVYDQLEVAAEEPQAPDDLPADDRVWAPPAAPVAHRVADEVALDEDDDFDDDDPVPVVVTAGGGRRDWDWDEIEVREVVSPARR
jgi:hypothetical protein